MNELGDLLQKLRGDKSIREASRGIGISHTYLDSLEKGYDPRTKKGRMPTLDILKKISIYYKVDYYTLLLKSGHIDEKEYKSLREGARVVSPKGLYTDVEVDDSMKWVTETPISTDAIVYMEELLKGKYTLKYKNKTLNHNDKAKIIKFIESFIIDTD